MPSRSLAMVVASALCSLVPTSALAFTGKDIMRGCEAVSEMAYEGDFGQTCGVAMHAGLCTGLAYGVAFELLMQDAVCLPKKLSPAEAGLVLRKFLRDHPELLHLPAEALAHRAIVEAYPCRKPAE